MTNGPRPKDHWDKLDIVAKLFSGVVLVGIAMVIKCGTDEIAASHRRGELVRSLLADLTTRDQQTRQDLALIALDHSLGDQNADLVLDIAERLVLDTVGVPDSARAAARALGSTAFRILERRAPGRADSVRTLIEEQVQDAFADPDVRAAARSAPDTATRTVASAVDDRAARAATDLLGAIRSRVVYIQYQGDVQRAQVEAMRRMFADAGFTAPGVERIETRFTSAVRFFHVTDSALADTVAQLARTFVQANGLGPVTLPVQDLTARRLRAPRGQIEVWISVR